MVEYGVHVKIHHHKFFLKLFATCDYISCLVEDCAAAVEDQFVLTSNHVGVGDIYVVVGGASGQHVLPELALASVVWGGVDVDDYLGASLSLHRGWAQGVPDVLTDVDSYMYAVDDEDWALVAGLEVSVLVEDTVVGEVHFVVDAKELTVVGYCGGVMYVVLGVHEAHHDGDALGLGDHLVHLLDVGLYEGGLEEKVFRGIACDCHLGEGYEVGLLCFGSLYVVEYLGGVAVEIADGGVNLGHGQA